MPHVQWKKALSLFFLLLCFVCPMLAQTNSVVLKAHHYLLENDTIIYAVKDTTIILDCETEYRIRKDISAYFVNRFNGRALTLFYKPESETTPVSDTVMHIKSENPFLKYQGRIIRTIIIQPLDVTGAKKAPVKIKLQRMLDTAFDAIHITTKVCVIRNNHAPSDVTRLVFDLSTVIELNFAQSAIQPPSFLSFE